MKKIGLLFTLLVTLSASQCKKEGDCHYGVNIVNSSNNDIVIATLSVGGQQGTCGFEEVRKIVSGATIFEYPLSYAGHKCIENSDISTVLPVYALDPNHYREGIYSCDSLDNYNTILKQFFFDLEDLQATDFTLTYP